MHKRALLCVMLLLLLLPLCALAEGLGFTVVPDILLPGKTERISFTAPSEGRATVTLQDQAGNETAVIRADMAAAAGVNNLTWDGLDENGQAVSPGNRPGKPADCFRVGPRFGVARGGMVGHGGNQYAGYLRYADSACGWGVA